MAVMTKDKVVAWVTRCDVVKLEWDYKRLRLFCLTASGGCMVQWALDLDKLARLKARQILQARLKDKNAGVRLD
jgi:hypothetical protein